MEKIFLFALVAVLSGTSCKKDKNECKLNSEDIMDTYSVTHVYEKANASATEVDVFPTWDQCERDDTYDFSGGGVYIVTDVGNLCSPNNSFTGTWALSGNNITVNGVTYAISNYSCSGMTLTTTNATTGATQRVVMVR